jgi:hypothetical protein
MRYSPRAALLLACVVATPCLAEKHTVQGVVQDEFGKPVQGAVLEFIRGEWSPDVWAIPIITPKVVGVIAGRDSYRSGRVVESHKTKTDQAGGFRQAMKSGAYHVAVFRSDADKKKFWHEIWRLPKYGSPDYAARAKEVNDLRHFYSVVVARDESVVIRIVNQTCGNSDIPPIGEPIPGCGLPVR